MIMNKYLFALILSLLAGCGSSQQPQPEPTPSTAVTTTTIHQGAISQQITLQAQTDYLHQITQTAPVTGYIRALPVRPDDMVRRGSLLFTMVSTEQQALGVATTPLSVHASCQGLVSSVLPQAGSSIVFHPDAQRLQQYGISLDDFSEQLSCYIGGVPLSQPDNVIEPDPSQAAMTGGLQIGSIQDGEQMRRVLLRFVNYSDNDPEKIMHQPIFLPDGTTRPVSFFAWREVIPGEIEQKRENLKSDITLTARLDQRDLGTTVADLQQRLNKSLHLPQGYTLQFGGSYAQQQQSFQELAMILGLAALLVFTVLLFLIRKWVMSAGILILAVMGLCGSLIALGITNTPLNVSSYTGMIMVVGIIAENAIFTLNQYDMNRKAGGSVSEAVDYAIALRIRPKLMTAISAILALMPLALGFGLGAQMQQPLAIAVIGGFCVALPLLLVVLPTIMLKVNKDQ